VAINDAITVRIVFVFIDWLENLVVKWFNVLVSNTVTIDGTNFKETHLNPIRISHPDCEARRENFDSFRSNSARAGFQFLQEHALGEQFRKNDWLFVFPEIEHVKWNAGPAKVLQ